MGGHHPINWDGKIEQKKHHGLKWLPVDDYQRNNQLKTGGRDKG
jgi:hypothetical protein